MSRASRTRNDIQETMEETACIEIACAVKGYQECRLSITATFTVETISFSLL